MAQFVAYFTLKGVWRSCDVVEIGTYGTELAAMKAGQKHALEHPQHDPRARGLVWRCVPDGLAAPTTFGRYDIRKATVPSA